MSTTTTPTVTAKTFYLSVVRAIGELTGYRSGKSASMEEVCDNVLAQAGFSHAQIEAVGAAHPNLKLPDGQVNDAHADGLHHITRRIGFAFRNQRAGTENGTIYRKKRAPLTVQVGHKQWGLTDAGLELAKSLKVSREEEAARRATPSAPAPVADSVTVTVVEDTRVPDAVASAPDEVTLDPVDVDDLINAVA